jgi:predicted flap endonuclease-1-like 5' DNA nuclease
MNGDFSRDSFDRRYHFSRVLLQQGRVLLDADWNEQTSILLHYIRSLAADLIGPHGGPGNGFRLEPDETGKELRCDFRIGRGHYYVDGILCENEAPLRCGSPDGGPPALTYTNQPHYPLDDEEKELDKNAGYFVYLDVWERHLTHLEAGHIREVALGGPDTASRTQVVWQVRLLNEDCCENRESYTCADWMEEVVRELPRCLRARARVPEPSDDPCIIPPESRYRGAENQEYRVEIHDGGEAGVNGATWKWSRDNGSVAFAIRTLQGSLATLDTLGPDEQRTLAEGDWVEIVDDRTVLRGRPGFLARVDSVDRVKQQVKLAIADGTELPVFGEDATTHPLLRRWDQGSAALPVQPGKWIDVEDGVQVWFEPGGTYETGDHWRIPARTATGDVIWPTEPDSDGTPVPQAIPPHGVEHHYAPLGRIKLDNDGVVTAVSDCRCVFPPACAEVKAPPAEPAAVAPIGIVTATPERTDTCTGTPAVKLSAQVVVGTPPLAYEWDFGDGTSISKDVAPQHKYTKDGIFVVRLRLSNKAGDHKSEATVAVGRCAQTATGGAAAGESTGITAGTSTVTGTLSQLSNVGANRAKALQDAGVTTVADVAALPVERIAEVLKVSRTVASGIRKSAIDTEAR